LNCPKCNFKQSDENKECVHCGVLFEKIKVRKFSDRKVETQVNTLFMGYGLADLKKLILKTKNNPPKYVFLGESLLVLAMVYITVRFMFASLNDSYILNSFLHIIILPFHEAGHVFLRPFPRLIMSMGGSIGQLVIPIICVAVFLFKTKDTFGAAVTFWWLGSSFVDLAPYIYDAKQMVMPLVGGVTGREAPYGYHDWNYILNETGLLSHYKGIAYSFYVIGLFIMLIAFVWFFVLLRKQFESLKSVE